MSLIENEWLGKIYFNMKICFFIVKLREFVNGEFYFEIFDNLCINESVFKFKISSLL